MNCEEENIQETQVEKQRQAYFHYCANIGMFVIDFEKLAFEVREFLEHWYEKENQTAPSFVKSTGGHLIGHLLEMNQKNTCLDGMGKDVVERLHDRLDSLNDIRTDIIHSTHWPSTDDHFQFLLKKEKDPSGSIDWKIPISPTETIDTLLKYIAQACTAVKRMKESFGDSTRMSKILEGYIPNPPPVFDSKFSKDMFATPVTSSVSVKKHAQN